MADTPKLVCTIPIEQLPPQMADWRELAAATIATEKVPNGVALVLPARLRAAASDLAAREAECCAFLSLEVTEYGDTVRLAITSEAEGADQVIAMLASGSR